jgi:DNA repair protein RadB
MADIDINFISSGNIVLDEFLNGGYEKDIITTIFGPSGSGKTTLAILTMVDVVRKGKKVIYIDTEASFSVERLKQVAPEDYNHILSNSFFLKPINFKEQQKAFDKLRVLVNDSIGLIIVDTISMLYRLEIGQTKDIYEVNKRLGMQISFLSELSRKRKIPILVANQVYSNFEEKDKVNMVGGDILKYGSKTLLEILIAASGVRSLVVRKARSMPEDNKFYFRLINQGIEKFNDILTSGNSKNNES